MPASDFDFSPFTPVNHLWPALVERLGSERSQQAIRQALDLQRTWTSGTLPVLFETCGLALASTDLVPENSHGERMVLILSSRSQEVQLLQHSDDSEVL